MSRRRRRPALVLAVLVIMAVGWGEPVRSDPLSSREAYLSDLIERSRQARLSGHRYWHLLLHYRTNLWGRDTSLADGPGFFLSPAGRTDPQAELEATLVQFFSDQPVGTSGQPAQCAFPARYQWLKNQLDFDPGLLPEQECERLRNWIRELDPESVTLIFPSAYMNNPASMFGHTLLRIDQRGQTEHTRLLAYAINYAANVTTDNGFSYAYQGIAGGFEGYFSILPYYIKVKEYSDMEDRDIWEYRLNFNRAQIERMLQHAWELGNTYFDYYFFKENCAYHLLSLLEIADPDLHLTDRFWIWTIPADTVRLIYEQPGLVVERTYRPARSTKIRQQRADLSKDEDLLLRQLTRDGNPIKVKNFERLPEERQAFLLDVAYDYSRYQAVNDGESEGHHEKNEELLRRRSELRVRSPEVAMVPLTEAPERGHRTSRAAVGYGFLEEESFEEISIRAVYHDLLDDETGYTRDAQIDGLHLRVRHYNHTDRTRLRSLVLANVISLFPMDSLFRRPSWKGSAAFETVREQECRNCNGFNINFGLGGAVEFRVHRRELIYAFAEADANYGNAYAKDFRVGGGGTIGLLMDLTRHWRAHLYGTFLEFPLGERSNDLRISVHQRYTVRRDLAIRLEWNRKENRHEALIAFQAYF